MENAAGEKVRNGQLGTQIDLYSWQIPYVDFADPINIVLGESNWTPQ